MKTRLLIENRTHAQVNLALPKEVLIDLNSIANKQNNNLHDLIYSYIVEGIASDSFAIKRMNLNEDNKRALEENNLPLDTVDELLRKYIY